MSDDDIFIEAMRERLVHWLEERGLATEGTEMLACVPLLWSGWEGDCAAVLYRLPGIEGARLWVADRVDIRDVGQLLEILETRMSVYESVAEKTRAFIAKAKALSILDRIVGLPPDPGDEMPEDGR